MDDCIIEVDQSTGQMTFCQGEHLLGDIWDTREEIQAFDRRNGQRFMVSVREDKVQARAVTLH